jgi:16S rRNA (guanine527-N7)-methyltransferase
VRPKTPAARDWAPPHLASGRVSDPRTSLAEGAHEILGRSLSAREQDLFWKYLTLLIKWQKSQRLVGSADPHWIVRNLFLDSLLFLRVLPSPLRTLLDLGSGAGLPGIPLKIVLDEVELVLVESRQKRVSFLSSAVRALGLRGARIVGRRVEDVAGELEGRFDAVVMRCAGNPGDVMPMASRLIVRPGGVVVAAGPPTPRPLPIGDWVTVHLSKSRTRRRFAVYRFS